MSIAFFQDLIESVESLSIEDQDYLFELIAMGTAKKGSAEEIMAYLLEDEEE